jgi:hypothetical protein
MTSISQIDGVSRLVRRRVGVDIHARRYFLGVLGCLQGKKRCYDVVTLIQPLFSLSLANRKRRDEILTEVKKEEKKKNKVGGNLGE